MHTSHTNRLLQVTIRSTFGWHHTLSHGYSHRSQHRAWSPGRTQAAPDVEKEPPISTVPLQPITSLTPIVAASSNTSTGSYKCQSTSIIIPNILFIGDANISRSF